MKSTFTLLLAVISFYFAGAQSAYNMNSKFDKHAQLVNGLLQLQSAGAEKAGMKTTAGVSMERIIAQSTRYNPGTDTLTDSLNLKYGINRGSFYDYNTMLYPYNYPYNASPMFNYAGTFTAPRVLFDTLRRWTVNPNTLIYGYYETDLAGYDANQNLTNFKELHVDSSIYPNMVHANTFTSANNISVGFSSDWIGGATDSVFKQYFTYNTANKLTKDSTYELHLGVWRIVSRSTYTYDGSNNLIQIDNYANTTDTSFLLPLPEQLRYTNTYDGSNRLLTVQSDYYTGSTLTPYVRDTFAYSGTYTYHNSWKQYQWDPINSYWAPMFYMTKVIGTAGVPDTVNIKGFDSLLNSWVPQTLYVMAYNTSNNPVTLKDYEYNFTSFPSTPDFTTHYYYETYLSALGTEHAVPLADNAIIFPNPATNTVTITGLNVPANTPIAISIINVNGQLLSRQSQPWNRSATISVNDLAPGTYWIMVRDAAGNMLHREAILKQ